MTRFYAFGERRAPWATAFLVFLTLDMIVASCAGSQDEVGAREAETDAGFVGDTNPACEVDSDACALTQELACNDVEWCPVNTGLPERIGLTAVWGSGPNDVWGVGAEGSVIHWDGNAWTSASIETLWTLHAVW